MGVDSTSSSRIKGFPRTEKPWGKELLLDHNSYFAFKRIEMKAGTRSSLQSHNIKQETIYVFSGEVELETRDQNGESLFERYGENEAYHLPAGTIHRVKVLSDCVLFEVSTPELDDVIRYEDDFGRK